MQANSWTAKKTIRNAINAHDYQYPDGMHLDFSPSSPALKNNTLNYAVKFKLSLDFAKFGGIKKCIYLMKIANRLTPTSDLGRARKL